VDHPCERCGTAVEDGRPFCPNCRAPQVRVELAAPASVISPEIGITPDALNATGLRPAADPEFFRTALQAGLLGVMANLITFGLGMVLTGILAALLYHRARGLNIRIGKAARLGAVAGAISFGATSFLIALGLVVLHSQQQFHDYMMKALEQGVTNRSDPDVQAFLQWLHTPQGFGMILAVFMVAAVLLSMLLAALGGVIGSTLFRGRSSAP
jgi:RNA polymerase subunit RPABC4/transcription elongation factor Spt4